MNITKLQARFNGQDGSLSLTKGKFYNLEMEEFSDIARQRTNAKIRIKINKNLTCDYSSLTSFLKNWTCIMVKS